VNDYTGIDDASGEYPIGTTLVTWTVVDIYGNQNTCSTTITIYDSIAPEIICPEDIVAITDPDSCWAVIEIPEPEVFDNCIIDSVWNDFTGTGNASAKYPLGVTVVTWYVVDIYGNMTLCEMTVTVIDETPPELSCPEDIFMYSSPDS